MAFMVRWLVTQMESLVESTNSVSVNEMSTNNFNDENDQSPAFSIETSYYRSSYTRKECLQILENAQVISIDARKRYTEKIAAIKDEFSGFQPPITETLWRFMK